MKKTLIEVLTALRFSLNRSEIRFGEEGKYAPLEIFEDFDIPPWHKRDDDFPNHEWIACYAVRGSSEGYWVHVDAIMNGFAPLRIQWMENGEVLEREAPDDCRFSTNLFLGKTFLGLHVATQVAALITEYLSDIAEDACD